MIDLNYLLIFLFVYVLNVIPGLMPPTWIVLAFFHLQFQLSLIPLVIIGALAATLGRISLAQLSRKYFRGFFPVKSQGNYETLGDFANTHKRLTIPAVFFYGFLPLPSNQVFIIAGLSKLNIKLVAFAFFCGHLLSYAFWVSLANVAVDHIGTIFSDNYSNIGTFIIEIIGLIMIYFIGKINWGKILKYSRR